MYDDIREARSYAHPPLNSFWQWAAAGEVIAWGSGATIAFRGELEAVLERLAPRGLPPLGAVLLLLAATRETWDGSLASPFVHAAIPDRLDDVPDRWKNEAADKILRGLDRVHALRGRLPMTTALRAELADVVFETYRGRTSPAFAAAVVRSLKAGLPESVLNPLPNCVVADPHHWAFLGVPGDGDWHPLAWLNDAKELKHGLERVDAEVLALRLKTGLDDVVKPAAVELTPAEQTRALIARLQEDDELSGLGRLARNLMAAVTLPRAVSDPEHLPLGGVSDISNRGPLDRLLLSELAHDDLTLAVRVANGEALYLRRELPPRTPPRQRLVLLESGIRSWGVPRVFATAVALALAATTDAHTRVVCYRAQGSTVAPVDLCSRAGLIEHLAALEVEAHPGAALAAFRAAAGACADSADLVLAASADVLSDRDFQTALGREELCPLHVATVCRDGRFQLQLLGTRGTKVLRNALLNLDELVVAQKTAPAPRLIDKTRPRNLPAILSVKPFPLRLPHALNARQSWCVADLGVLALSRDRRLTLWTEPRLGPVQIADDIPPGELLWASPEAHEGTVKAVIGELSSGKITLLTIHLTAGCCDVAHLNVSGPCEAVCAHNGVLFAVSGGRINVFDDSGNPHAQIIPSEELIWKHDRFFRSGAGHCWYALAYDGWPVVERVLDDSDEQARSLMTMFECRGVDGAVGVTLEGNLYFTAEKELVPIAHGLGPPLEVAAISRSGDYLVLSGGKKLRGVSVKPRPGVGGVPGDPFAFVERLSNFARPRSLRTQFTHVGVSKEMLILRSRKNTLQGIDRDIRFVSAARPGREFPLQPVPVSPGVGYALTAATWPDGSRVLLDSRGLLHLQSADRAIPETTIVLSDGLLSGWCSDGRVWGVPYFIGTATSADRAAIYQSAIRAFTERLP